MVAKQQIYIYQRKNSIENTHYTFYQSEMFRKHLIDLESTKLPRDLDQEALTAANNESTTLVLNRILRPKYSCLYINIYCNYLQFV